MFEVLGRNSRAAVWAELDTLMVKKCFPGYQPLWELPGFLSGHFPCTPAPRPDWLKLQMQNYLLQLPTFGHPPMMRNLCIQLEAAPLRVLVGVEWQRVSCIEDSPPLTGKPQLPREEEQNSSASGCQKCGSWFLSNPFGDKLN